MKGRSYVWSLVYFAGFVGVFVGERLIAAGSLRTFCTLLGLGLLVMSTVARAVRVSQSEGGRRLIERYLLIFYAVGLAALALYFVQSDIWVRVATKSLQESAPRLATVLAVLWPSLVLLSLLPVLLIELSYASMLFAPQVEAVRVRDAALTGAGLAGALVFAFSIVYVGYQRDMKWDLSYFRTAKPSASTSKIAAALTEPVEVSLFFPPANEVRQQVVEYFQGLARSSPQLEIHYYDQAVDPARARELGVTGNGAIVLSRGTRREQLVIGTELERARGQLQTLDQEIQKRILAIAKTRRTLYFTSGHGERSNDQGPPTNQLATIVNLRELFTSQNYELRYLGAAEGLANDVPNDAGAVLIIGPTGNFLSEEVSALRRYMDRNGRLFIALDPESKLEFNDLLAPLGLRFNPTVLANDQFHVRRNNQASDRAFIAGQSFSSHPSVTTLSQLRGRAVLFVIGAGYLSEIKDRPQNLAIDFTVRSHPATWPDANGNFQQDPNEQRRSYELAAAVSRKKPGGKPEDELRAIVVADSDCLSDLVLQNPGNAYFALDGIKWLMGDESLAGEVSSEVDVPVEHTRKQDVVWFYSTIFLVPALVLGVGFAATRRRASKRRALTEPPPGETS